MTPEPSAPRGPSFAATGSTRRAGGWREPALVAVVLAAVVAALHGRSLITGLDWLPAEAVDSQLILFLLEHWRDVLTGGAADWRSPPMFWPLAGTIGMSDLLAGLAPLYAGLRALGATEHAALNGLLILCTALSFLLAFRLLRATLGIGLAGSLAGAALYAGAYPRLMELGHPQVQVAFVLPLAVDLALRLVRDGTDQGAGRAFGRTAALGAALVVQLATAVYPAWFTVFFLAVTAAVALAAGATRRAIAALLRRHWPALAAAAALTALLALPVVAAFSGADTDFDFRVSVLPLIPRPLSLLWPGPESFAWGAWFPPPEQAGLPRLWGKRVSYGFTLVPLVLAAAGWAVAVWGRGVARTRPSSLHGPDGRALLVAVIGVAGLIVGLLSLRYGGASPWAAVHAAFPGAEGYRAVFRNWMFLALPLATVLAWLTDRALGAAARLPAARRRAARAALAAVAALVALEQVGSPVGHAGAVYRARLDRLAARVPPGCASFLLRPAPAAPPTAATFDPDAYLAANADVRRGWPGTAWEHYVRFGRDEGRFLDPADGWRSVRIHIDALGVAARLGIPTVNGYTGRYPEGWPLINLFAPDLDARAAAWAARHALTPAPCVVDYPPELYAGAETEARM